MNACIETVLGPRPLDQFGVTDAHNHIWIEPVEGAAQGAPVLIEREAILRELRDYRAAGGFGVLDCQPGGCGRNAAALARLSEESGVAVVACSGYHRQRYYAPEHQLWRQDADTSARAFVRELREGTEETRDSARPVRAGYVKLAIEASLAETPLQPLEGALRATIETGAALLAHTERGLAVEDLLDLCLRRGMPARRLILCHIDKRPDLGLHRELARAGALLEYDTFYRPFYKPEDNAWLLVERMAAAGLEDGVALATDMADKALWRFAAGPGAPGLPGFVETIRARLVKMGLSEAVVEQMMGKNVAERLAFSK